MKIYDLVIIGSGPAGINAAQIVSEKGGSVIIIDDHPKVGGKLHGQLHQESNGEWWIGKEIANNLYEQIIRENITILNNYQAWSIVKEDESGLWCLLISDITHENKTKKEISAKHVLLATGSIEKPLPVLGWDLPGVLSIGGAQVLTNDYGLKVGKKAAFVGVDILSLSIARSLKLAGVEVVGIFIEPPNKMAKEPKTPMNKLKEFKDLAKHAPSLLMRLGSIFLQNNFGRKLALIFYPKKGMKVWGIPLYLKETIDEIVGENEVEAIQTVQINNEGEKISNGRKIDVDVVCTSGGLSPQNELAEIAGCSFVRLNGLSGVVPLHNEKMETEIKNLYVAGNITGIESAKVAAAQGKVAGHQIANELGLSVEDIDKYIQEVNQVREFADITFHPNIYEARKEIYRIWNEKIDMGVV